MPETRDKYSYDPKSLDNPANKREEPKPVTNDEIGFLEYNGESPNNPKNRPQSVTDKTSQTPKKKQV